MPANMCSNSGKKSVIWAYILWLFGGPFGVHHFYLRRDRHAFVWWTTLGGFGIGWLGEVFRIPRYVRDANEDPKHMEELIGRMIRNKKDRIGGQFQPHISKVGGDFTLPLPLHFRSPQLSYNPADDFVYSGQQLYKRFPPFSMNRFTGMMMVGYSWGQMMLVAIPSDEVWGINFRYLNYLIPLVVTLGVWTVGNIGREQGTFKWPLLAAYVSYPLRYFIYDETVWFTIMVMAAALAFDSFSKQWRRTPRSRHFVKRVMILGLCGCLYLSLWCSYLYFNGTITDSEGDELPIYEALHHFFTSPWWLDVKQCLIDTYQYAQHHGWYEVWKQIIDLSDPRGEQNAYKVLGLSPESTQQEITSTWRRLSREHHPDKVKDLNLRRAAQERFMEIQQAYEILSNSKHRRNRRNKKDNSE